MSSETKLHNINELKFVAPLLRYYFYIYLIYVTCIKTLLMFSSEKCAAFAVMTNESLTAF